MNRKVLAFLKNIFTSMAVNITRIVITFVLTLVLPKFLSETDYSYWQLYLFYFTYLAYTSLGWCEGSYLKYGGEEYDQLPKRTMAGQFWILTFYEVAVNVIFAIFVLLFVKDEIKVVLLLCAALSAFLDILRYYIQIVLQATYRIASYARIAMCERLLFLVFTLVFLLLGKREFIYFVGAELLARVLSLAFAVIICRDIVFVRLPKVKEIGLEAKELISIGYKLLVANLASQLIIGTVRFAIENKWGNLVFGKVSLALSMVNMFITMLAAVSIVVFPMLKKLDHERLAQMYGVIREVLTTILLCVFALYVPVKMILNLWLPQYEVSLKYLAILLPVCLFETRYMVLLATYYKALRLEKKQLMVNLISVAASVLGTGVVVYGLNSLEGSIVLIVVLIAFKAYFSERQIKKVISVKQGGDAFWEIGMVILFMACGWFLDSWISTGVYLCFLFLYLFCRRSKIKDTLLQLKLLFRARD